MVRVVLVNLFISAACLILILLLFVPRMLLYIGSSVFLDKAERANRRRLRSHASLLDVNLAYVCLSCLLIQQSLYGNSYSPQSEKDEPT